MSDIEACRAAIAELESQRATLGDAVVDLATAPLRAKLAGMQPVASLQLRQVTVLFAEVVGSTFMAQGRVLKFTGDGVKAALGMDGSREDDEDRTFKRPLAFSMAPRTRPSTHVVRPFNLAKNC